jgi:hypothetical protein
LLTWLTGRSRREKAPLYLTGLILPSVAGAWQVALGLTQPSATQVLRLGHTLTYLHQGLAAILAGSAVYRLVVLLEYLGLFLLPLIPVLLVCCIRNVRERAEERLPLWKGLALVAITAVGLYALSYRFYALSYRFNGTLRPSLMPSLGWVLTLDSSVERSLLTVATTACGALLAVALCIRYIWAGGRGSVSPGEKLLIWCSAVMFVLNVLYVQYCDTYLIVYTPVALMAIAKEMPRWPWGLRTAYALAWLPVIALASMWTRSSLAEEETYWRAAEEIRLQDVMPSRVAGDLRWSCYYGAFDDWVAEVGGIGGVAKYNAMDSHSPLQFNNAFLAFLDRRSKTAEYLLEPCCPAPGDGSRIVKTVAYPGMFFESKVLYVLRRDPQD